MLLRSMEEECGARVDPSEATEMAKAAWDNACRDFAGLLNAPVSWQTLHFPFPVSYDNAKVHDRATVMMLSPRVEPHVEEQILDEAACKQLLGVTSLRERMEKTLGDKEKEYEDALPEPVGSQRTDAQRTTAVQRIRSLRHIISLYDQMGPHRLNVELRELRAVSVSRRSPYWQLHQKVNAEVFNHCQALFEPALDAYLAQTGAEWQDVFRRQMARQDPRWRCLIPEQILPLSPVTPDLHCTAEMLVAVEKKNARKLIQSRAPDDPDLLQTAWMQEEIVRANEFRNLPQEDRPTDAQIELEESVAKARAIHRRVATDKGETVEVEVNFGEARRRKQGKERRQPQIMQVEGTGGYYAGGKFA